MEISCVGCNYYRNPTYREILGYLASIWEAPFSSLHFHRVFMQQRGNRSLNRMINERAVERKNRVVLRYFFVRNQMLVAIKELIPRE